MNEIKMKEFRVNFWEKTGIIPDLSDFKEEEKSFVIGDLFDFKKDNNGNYEVMENRTLSV